MRLEGVLRHLAFDLGRWADMAVYAILREEWRHSPLYAPHREPFTEAWTRADRALGVHPTAARHGPVRRIPVAGAGPRAVLGAESPPRPAGGAT